MLGDGASALFLTPGGWSSLVGAATQSMAAYHAAYPLRPGMPREELRNRLALTSAVFNQVARELGDRGHAAPTESGLRLPQHTPVFTPAQRQAAQAFMALLASDPYSPPTGAAPDPEVVQALTESGEVVKAGDDVVFTRAAFDDMLRKTRDYARDHDQLTIQGVRELFGTSRKYTLAFLEHLDRMQITRRDGDIRTLR
jgi:selenocysteine-specific elongation factor